ncbi:efflux RND transporter periplasmic adaptor subunit [Gelidibacter salicanalis]|uniref:Efflux RND transporter periplasmic adaptor subunit n=1 Tax=Gelidibacter salicanalis TaxID=291193 RepID=A0A934KRK7_9FLAO|nr:efflux RND transporter periplasmic adaptor subunit [Gelidibacter salicanalis]MBJ7882529.1 efflux RND transporter periplasmic adaptor subunit [Gelidibacter salicanalis]
MKYIFIISVALVTSLLIGCNNKEDSKDGQNEENASTEKMHDTENDPNLEGVVQLTKQQAETIGLEMKPLEERNLGNNIKVTGTLELFPQDKANISPFIGGNVSSIKVIPGDNVSKGQVLAYIEHPDIIAMQQEYQERNNELVFLKQDFERKQILYDKGVSSGKEFQMAQSKFRSTTSSVNGLRSQLRLLGINPDKVAAGQIYSAVPITTPISGYVDEVMISLGDFVAQQSKMFSISDNSKIYVNFKVYEKDIKQIKKGQQIYFSTASRPDELLEATVRSIGKTFNTDPKALEVLADIENKDKNLLPGMYVQGRIVQGEKKAFAVPEAAIIKEGEQSFIFILEEDKKMDANKMEFEMVPVTVGITDLGFVEINLPAEVSKNAKVVISGAYNLFSEMVKGELEHGH